MFRRFAIFTALMLFVAGQNHQASAALIIGNGSLSDPSTGAGLGFGAHSGYGKVFAMGGTAATAKSASVLMDYPDLGAASKTFNARIYDASSITSSNPTPLISAQFTASFSNAGSSWFNVDFGAGLNLSANSSYVFAIEEAVVSGINTGIAWAPPISSPGYTSGIGASLTESKYYSRLDGADYVLSGSNQVFGFQLSTEAVPEPSSLALMGMGLASIAAAAKKARRKKAGVDSAEKGVIV
jgi:hypothetical protein